MRQILQTEGLVLRCAPVYYATDAAGWRWDAVVISVENQIAVPRFRGPERTLGKATLRGVRRLKGAGKGIATPR